MPKINFKSLATAAALVGAVLIATVELAGIPTGTIPHVWGALFFAGLALTAPFLPAY